ncbi:8-cyclase (Molybdenum cofactor biosynthesis protein A) [Durusdinium trenchii]|uniref:8-cyclase (Molybdenum cofactor biosynthesis protein A) n=1 Tax=Durusdinium trenchii TaxID=1381693 RepID=A0ABP0LEC9_9DINO
MIALTHEPIELEPLVAEASQPAAGAVVAFVGITRAVTGDKHTDRLAYEAYEQMAEAKLAELEASARKRWPLVECLLVHRLGEVPITQASVAVVVSSAHRRASFEAAEWLIDTLKQDVPIWKQEHYQNGETEWEITRFVGVVVPMGVNRIRITGGEPLVRAELPKLIAMLRTIGGLEDLALTTNGMLLGEQAQALKAAGLDRLNISLDTLDEAKFERITRRQGLDKVLDGIDAAQRAGFESIRLNALAIRDETEDEVVPLVEFARARGLVMRFIEFMPLDADATWQHDRVLTGAAIRAMLERELGSLEPAERNDTSQPAVDYDFTDGSGRVGFINPVSEPFCGACDRLRLTAEGQVRNCLFSTTESDARELLRSGASDAAIEQLVRDSIAAKKPGHGIDDQTFLRPQRAMYQIGG